MQKQIHVNSYVKRNGTQVREHFRNIDTDNFAGQSLAPDYSDELVMDGQDKDLFESLFPNLPNIFNPTMNMDSAPVLQGGVSVDVGLPTGEMGDVLGSIGDALGAVIAIGVELAPIAIQIYQTINGGDGQAAKYLKMQFRAKVKQLDNKVAQMKTNIDNNVTRLINAKNKIEYAMIYEPLQKDWQAYRHAKNIVNRIKTHANNNDFQSVAKDLENFTSKNQKQIISDLLQPNVKLQNNINNVKNLIKKFNLDDKFKYALSHNTSGINHNADFSHYGNKNIKINNLLNKNKPNAKEMANIFLAKPQNIPLSREYSYIPKGNANILNYKYKLLSTNKEIPQNWEGIVFNQYSSLSKNVSNSVEMQNKIRSEFNIMRANTLNDKLEVDFSKDSNLHLSIGHATVLEPYIDSQGYFHGILFDKYDFNKLYEMLYKNPKVYFANNYFWLIQHMQGHNYYILAPIIFKW